MRVARTSASFDSTGALECWICEGCWLLVEEAILAAGPVLRARREAEIGQTAAYLT